MECWCLGVLECLPLAGMASRRPRRPEMSANLRISRDRYLACFGGHWRHHFGSHIHRILRKHSSFLRPARTPANLASQRLAFLTQAPDSSTPAPQHPSTSAVKSHPNLQMGVGVTSGDKAFIGGELLRTGFRLCHSDVWTFLDFFDHHFCKYALILDWFRIFLLFKCLLRFSKAAGGQQECRSEKRHSSDPRPISEV